jgi:PBP1b-binding outer membrane lipoprotein LpoB|tara:strand:- start:285 stop:473 length:189 start_codon:yes stop_codon:yes gene_type:complete
MKRVIAILAVVLVMVSCGGKVSEESVEVVDSTAVVVDSVVTETPTIDTTEVQPVREEPIGIK